ncbi:MAG: Tyrosine-protein kinase YwqD [Pelotomaculum sp. PtaB.Bin104]|nr:MAG: Tyrosine-protein kinase YwqD [Pelotomaculum sp. PtaB.Bin104]
MPGKAKEKKVERKLYTQIHPMSAIAESFRTLRTNIAYSSTDQPCRVILITSPGPGEGKTTIASNLGVVMAQAGSRVMILDCDFRRPVMHHVFGLDQQTGLTNLLAQDLEVGEVVQSTEVEGLSVITCGPIPPNPSEMLGSQKMKDLLEKLSGQYDVVLLDSPPVVAVTDASVLASQVDGVILVFKTGKSRIDIASDAIAQLEKANARILGVILNKVKTHGGRYYRYNYHYYSSSAETNAGQ